MSLHPFAGKKSLSSDLVEYIKQKILSGQLKPGDRIVETKLARELGISQTPLREAIHQLAGEGIVTIVPNKGTSVAVLTPHDVFEIYTLRANLEGLAIKLAILNRTPEDIDTLENHYEEMKRKGRDESVTSLAAETSYLHRYIYQMSKHSHLISMIDAISFKIALVNSMVCMKYSKQKEVEEHAELIEAVKKADPIHAEKVMKAHLHRAYCTFIEAFAGKGDYDDFWEVL